MAYRELKDGTRGRVTDYHTKRQASRIFRVDNADPVAAQAEVDLDQGGMNSPFPGDGGLIVDSISAVPVSDSLNVDVVYNYSSDRRASLLPRVNKDRLFYYGFRESITTTDVKYPYARYEPHTVGGVTKFLWTIHEERTTPESRSRVWVNVTISNWDLSKRAFVLAQMNKLHNLGNAGVFYLFLGAEGGLRTDSSSPLYDITYSWLCDNGGDAPPVPGYSASLAFPNVPRPAWHEWEVVPAANPETTKPIFSTSKRFDETLAPNGWTTLPGIPNF